MFKIIVFTVVLISVQQLKAVIAQDTNVVARYKDIVCNHTLWKQIMEPYLRSEAQRFRNPKDSEAQANFEKFTNILNQQNDYNTGFSLCDKQKFLECNEDNKCVCGTTMVPYSYEQVGSRCLATRGSICLTDKDCLENDCRSPHYCGGEEAFLEKSDSSAIGKVSYSWIIGVLIASRII